jgi:hypothetical protein
MDIKQNTKKLILFTWVFFIIKQIFYNKMLPRPIYKAIHERKLCWSWLSKNPNAISTLEKNPENIDWDMLSRNPNAIHILEKNLDEIVWDELSINPNAIHLLEANPENIDWGELSMNPNAIHLLEKNLNKIDWWWLSQNPNAIPILEKYPDKINWESLSWNPNAGHLLFKLDFDTMREKNMAFAEELAAYVFHPLRMGRICEVYGLDLEELNDIY